MKSLNWLWGALLWLAIAEGLPAYPLDALEETGIQRLEAIQLAQAGKLKGPPKQPAGALLGMEQVKLRLLDYPDFQLPEANAEVGKRIQSMFEAEPDRFAFAFLDITDPKQPLYAEHNGTKTMNPGSVGKILVALALLDALAAAYPEDIEARRRVMR